MLDEAVKFGQDVIKGAWDTMIVAPFKFGNIKYYNHYLIIFKI